MLFTIEGLEGSGKTMVAEALQDEYPRATHTGEPTDSRVGDAVRRARDANVGPLARLFLCTSDHADHLARVVKPALERGDVVVSDRFSDSRYAYQGAALEGHVTRPMEYVRGIHQPFTVPPDATIYLDVDPETGAARSGATDEREQAAFLSQVRANYEDLMDLEPGRFVRVDATQPPEAVIEDVEDAFDRIVDQHR